MSRCKIRSKLLSAGRFASIWECATPETSEDDSHALRQSTMSGMIAKMFRVIVRLIVEHNIGNNHRWNTTEIDYLCTSTKKFALEFHASGGFHYPVSLLEQSECCRCVFYLIKSGRTLYFGNAPSPRKGELKWLRFRNPLFPHLPLSGLKLRHKRRRGLIPSAHCNLCELHYQIFDMVNWSEESSRVKDVRWVSASLLTAIDAQPAMKDNNRK